MEDKLARCGVMSYEQFKERTIKITKGEYKPKEDEPKIWFESLNAAAQILNEDNMRLLKIINETDPESITALARSTGRKKGNLSRTLKKLQDYGIVSFEKRQKAKKPIANYHRFSIEYGTHSVAP